MGKAYLDALYSGRRFKKLAVGIAGLARRLFEALRLGTYDAVVVEKECVPHAPYLIERGLLWRAKRIILDYDDAVWVAYEGSALNRDKIRNLMRRSEAVVAGSRHLEQYARESNPNTFFVPTVVDLARYGARSGTIPPNNRSTVIGWIGTPVTAKFLSVISEALRRLASRRQIVFLCVGGGDALNIPGVLIRRLPWKLETEAECIAQMDIGIMPLTDDPFSRGKCGYKLIQYMAGGVPAVASDVGENRHIIVDGETGFLIRRSEDWETALDKLCDSPALRQEMGAKGRERVAERYNVSHAVEAYVRILKNISS